jgi:hypothetical protein
MRTMGIETMKVRYCSKSNVAVMGYLLSSNRAEILFRAKKNITVHFQKAKYPTVHVRQNKINEPHQMALQAMQANTYWWLVQHTFKCTRVPST